MFDLVRPTFAPASARPRDTSRPIPRAPPRDLLVELKSLAFHHRHTSDSGNLASQVECLGDMLIRGLRKNHVGGKCWRKVICLFCFDSVNIRSSSCKFFKFKYKFNFTALKSSLALLHPA